MAYRDQEWAGCVIFVILVLFYGFEYSPWSWLVFGSVAAAWVSVSLVSQHIATKRRVERPCSHGVKGAHLDKCLCTTCEAEAAVRLKQQEAEKRRIAETARKEREKALQEYRRKIRLPSFLKDMDPTEFEHLVCDLFCRIGYSGRRTPTSGDHGADGILEKDGEVVILQAKRVKGSVGEPVLRDLFGTMHAYGAAHGIVVTTGTVSKQARDWVGGKRIRIVELGELTELIKRHLPEDEVVPESYESSQLVTEFCPKCNRPLRKVKGKYGSFMGCSGYPECRFTRRMPKRYWRLRR